MSIRNFAAWVQDAILGRRVSANVIGIALGMAGLLGGVMYWQMVTLYSHRERFEVATAVLTALLVALVTGGLMHLVIRVLS